MRLLLLSALFGCATRSAHVDAIAELADARAATSGPDALLLDDVPMLTTEVVGVSWAPGDGPTPGYVSPTLRWHEPPRTEGCIYVGDELDELR